MVGQLLGCPSLDGWLVESVGVHPSTSMVSIILVVYTNTHKYMVAGVAGIIWYLVWLWLAFEKPSKHPTITAQELHYIEKSIGPVSGVAPNFKTTPWKEIFHSKPVYAIIVANFCRSWTFYLLLLSQITYFSQEFKFSVAEVRVYFQ
jgi:hypothetical protein